MKTKLLYTFIAIWFFGMSYTIAHMHGIHLAVFENKVEKSDFKISEIPNDFGMIHILTEECGCSQIIAEYLIERKATPGISESVMFLGDSKTYEQSLSKSGFKILKSKNIKSYIEGVPLLIIHNKAGEIKYSGGYAKTMVTPITKIQDLALLEQIKNKTAPENFHIQGCAVAKNLQKELDPLGLKYSL